MYDNMPIKSMNSIYPLSPIENTRTLSMIKQTIELNVPDLEIHNDAIIFPGRATAKDWIEDLVYDYNLSPIKLARLHFSRNNPKRIENSLIDKFKENTETFEYIETGIYCGILFAHFAHFLLESLSRLWIINDLTIDKNIYFIFHSNRPIIDMTYLKRSKFYEYFSLLGIEDQIKIVNKPIKCKQLFVPEQAYHMPTVNGAKLIGSYAIVDLWNKIARNASSDRIKESFLGKRLYFSRSNMKKTIQNRKLLNEIELENILIEYGFEIIFPHDLESEEEKIALLSNAEILMGLNGTGLHNSIFMKEDTIVIQLLNSWYNNGIHTQSGLCLLKKLNLYTIIVEPTNKNPEWYVDINKIAKTLEKIGITKKGD